MAASAKAILFGTVHHEEIVDFLRQKMGVDAIKVQLHGKDAGNYATLTFHDPVLEGDIRQMTIFGNDLPGYEDVGLFHNSLFSLSCPGRQSAFAVRGLNSPLS